MRSKLISTLAVLALTSLAGTAHAVPVLANVWYEFGFTGVGVAATGCLPADPAGLGCIASSGTPTVFAPAAPWTYTSGPTGAAIVVTDAFLLGDQFAVWDSGALAGFTSLVAVGGDCGNDPLGCVGPASSGIFYLSPGPHEITIVTVLSPFGAGAGYFQIVDTDDTAPIPEPGTMLLLGIGLTGLRLARRRQ